MLRTPTPRQVQAVRRRLHGTVQQWQASAMKASGTGAVITETLINTTTEPVVVHYLITPSVNGCTGTQFDLSVTVNPTAVITSGATANWCNNVENTYTATSSSSTATFAWDRSAVAGISNAATSGTGAVITETLINTTTEPVVVHYLITPSVNGCTGTQFDLSVTVNPTAVITSGATANWCNNVETPTPQQVQAVRRHLHGTVQQWQASAMQQPAEQGH